MFELTCSGTISPTLFLSPSKQMSYTKAEFLLLMCTPSPAPQRSSSNQSTLWDLLILTAPGVLLRLTPAAAGKTVPSLLPCVIIIVPGGLRLRSVEPLVPGQETSSPAGGCSYPSCRIFYLLSFGLSTGFPEFKEIFNLLWCVCIRVPCSEVLVQLFRSTATDCGWFFSLMLGFSNNSSRFWEPQDRVAFSVSSGGRSYLGCRLFETL